jgi:hypothetical protein
MKFRTSLPLALAFVAAFGLVIPIQTFAAPQGTVVQIDDVKLHKNGSLYGVVLTSELQPAVDKAVMIQRGKEVLATTKTNESGGFGFAGLNSGVYQLVGPEGQRTVRVWTEKAAPPSAAPQAVLVNDTVRAQYGMQRLKVFLSNPFVIAAIIATAVAIPVAIHNSGSSTPASP